MMLFIDMHVDKRENLFCHIPFPKLVINKIQSLKRILMNFPCDDDDNDDEVAFSIS